MAHMAVSTGRRKGPSSPNSSTHPSPAQNATTLPRLKLSLRHTPTPPPSKSQNKTYARSRMAHANQRNHLLDDSDSDLTPPDDDDDEMDFDEDEGDKVTPRMSKNQKGKAVDHTPKTTVQSVKKKTTTSTAKKAAEKATSTSATKNVGTNGPGGREKKRALKVGEMERRRARDEKFDVNVNGDAFAITPSRIRRSPQNFLDSDSESSYGDDESDHELAIPIAPDLLGESSVHPPSFAEDYGMDDLPNAFAGQEIEDLAYGGGAPEFEMERQVLSGLWSDDEDEDEELHIAELSGSEAELQSQSSVHESDSADETSEEDSSTDDELDEFGFPRPTTAVPIGEEGPLVLMENWDGQFVLVQPRQERTRRRGSRGSRTNASIGESTVLSGTDQQALIIDADADDASSSEWSGMSDEDDGGDTTDSMAEEDMPMLDSPALDMIIEEMGMGTGASNPTPFTAPNEIPTPNIIVTDPSGTPTLSTPAMQTPAYPTPIIVGAEPSTPAPMPVMGTFHATTDDPAQHAVIDGSKIPTKSPFTHGRRSRRGRASSVSTTNTNGTERKRKSSNGQTVLPPFADPFFPTTLPKRARYSSIPGHPRFVAAKRQQERDRMAMLEGMEETSDEAEIGLDLEDMLDEEMLLHETVNAHSHSSNGFRFDRVPVSTYLRRNFGGGRRQDDLNGHMVYSSPVQRRTAAPAMQLAYDPMTMGYTTVDGVGLGMGPMGYSVGAEGWGLEDTLAGPPARMMLVSPAFPAVAEGNEGVDNPLSRKEKRRRKRMGGAGAATQGVPMAMEAVPPMQL